MWHRIIIILLGLQFVQSSCVNNIIGSVNGSVECSSALDQLEVLSKRSQFTWHLDSYIGGDHDQWSFIPPLICDTFDYGLIRTPLGLTGPFLNRSSLLEWLYELPDTTFDGLAEHHLVNLITQPEPMCQPTVIYQMNYSPNWLRIRPIRGVSLFVTELSRETMKWTKDLNGTWCIQTYQVNSSHLYWESSKVDLYQGVDKWMFEGGFKNWLHRLVKWLTWK